MSEERRRAVAVTGSNGYVGGAVCSAFAAADYRVIALQRSAPTGGGWDDHIPYSLEQGLSRTLPRDVVAVVHCAYDLRARDRSVIERVNVGGTQRLLTEVGTTPVVLISSMSAFEGTTQVYGRTKLACEALVTLCGGTSLRLGLVYGDAVSAGMVGALGKVAGAPVVPLPHPDPVQYTLHVDDMARCVVSAVENPPADRVLGVAHPRQVHLTEIISELRATTGSGSLRSVRVPVTAIRRLLDLAETMGLRLNFRADSVIGLMHPAPGVPHVDHWPRVGILLRDFATDELLAGRT